MVRHQAVGITDPVVPLDNVTQDLQEFNPVLVVQEDVLTGVTAAGDVIPRSPILNPQRPCYTVTTPNYFFLVYSRRAVAQNQPIAPHAVVLLSIARRCDYILQKSRERLGTVCRERISPLQETETRHKTLLNAASCAITRRGGRVIL